ncbi:MAG: hypothetical protein ACRDRO_08190 [Pseudonocardiaceae bacterium]
MTTSEPKPSETIKRRKAGGQGATRGHSQTSPEAIERLERDKKCVQLRRAGVHWDTIADQLSYSSPGHAHDRFMALMREYPREDVETTRELIAGRLEVVIRTLTPKVVKADTWAIDRYLRACEQLAKLTGANRAERVEVSVGASELDVALRELQVELQARAAGSPVPQE